jgi:hypothetical protein
MVLPGRLCIVRTNFNLGREKKNETLNHPLSIRKPQSFLKGISTGDVRMGKQGVNCCKPRK